VCIIIDLYLCSCIIGSVQYVVQSLYLLFSNYATYVFNILFMFVFYFVRSVVFLIFCVLFLFSYIYIIHIRVQVYRPLPPGGNLISVNNYHIIILKWIFKKWDGGKD
jgi:hypothetical protein